MRSEKLDGLEIRLGDRAVRSSIRVTSGGAYHVAVETVLPDRGIELHSFYTGHPSLDRSQVTHLELAPASRTITSRELNAREIPVVWARRRCVFDHLARLSGFLSERDLGPALIDFEDELLLGVESA